jgi:phosphoheptose isomerase
MANIKDVMRDAINPLDYAVMALEAPEKAAIRDTLEELKEARQTVANMLAALERIVEVEGNGGSAIGMRHIALAAIKRAKGEA